MDEVIVEVSGLAPAKGEALPCSVRATHTARAVEALIRAAREAVGERNCPLGSLLVGLVLVICRPGRSHLKGALLGGASPTCCKVIVEARSI